MKRHLLLLFLITSFGVFANEPLVIHEQERNIKGTPYFDVFVDSNNNFSPEKIFSNKKPHFTNKSTFGFTKKTLWFKGKIINKSKKKREWFLDIDSPHLDSIEYYIYNSGILITKGVLGDAFKFDQREIEYTGFIVPLDLLPGEEYDIILRVKSSSALEVPIKLHSAHIFEKLKFPTYLIFGIYYGILAVMFIYNLIISFTLNDKNYLFYSLSIVATLFFMVSYNGHGFEFLWPNSPDWNHRSSMVLLCIAGVFIVLITINFLDLRTQRKKFYRLFQAFMFINIGFGLYALLKPGLLDYEFILNSIGIQIPMAIVAGLLSWKKGNTHAKFFVVAWIIYQIGGTLAILGNLGYLEGSFWVNNSVYIGSVLEIVLLSFALSFKYQKIRFEKEKAQKEIIELQAKEKDRLEQKVKERTQKLNKANENLKVKNKHVMDSILYAKGMQGSILPARDLFNDNFTQNLIYYKPKDIVSGDFYWYGKVGESIIIASVDCTGHGVPGAMLTMIASNLLENIVYRDDIVQPNQILERIDKLVKKRIHNPDGRDGMDISIIHINRNDNTFQFSGAFSDIYCKTKDGFKEIKGSKKVIGSDDYEHKNFELISLPLNEVDTIFMFSDGYKDQFGEENGKRFMKKTFYNILQGCENQSLFELEKQLDLMHREWKGKEDQTDDIMVLGFKL